MHFFRQIICFSAVDLWLGMKEKTTHKSTLCRKTLNSGTMTKKERRAWAGEREDVVLWVHMRFYALESQRTTSIRHTYTLSKWNHCRESERKKQYIEFVVVVVIVVVVCMFFFVFRLVLYISTACSLFTTVLCLCYLKFEYISVPPGICILHCIHSNCSSLHIQMLNLLGCYFHLLTFLSSCPIQNETRKTEFHFGIMHKVPNVQHG